MFGKKTKKVTVDQILRKNGITATPTKPVDKTLARLNKILDRKDLQNLDNNKVDTLRMLAFYLEDEDGIMDAAKFVKFLKA